MQQANEQLPPHQRAQPDRLSALLQRCEVRAAYLQLYASLCLQSHKSLRQLAFEAGTDEKPVEVSKLLEATGGPWLLGRCRKQSVELLKFQLSLCIQLLRCSYASQGFAHSLDSALVHHAGLCTASCTAVLAVGILTILPVVLLCVT